MDLLICRNIEILKSNIIQSSLLFNKKVVDNPLEIETVTPPADTYHLW